MSDALCPDESDLQQLLAGEMAPDRCLALSDHVESCATCQAALSRLTDSWQLGLPTRVNSLEAISDDDRSLLGRLKHHLPQLPDELPASMPLPAMPGFDTIGYLGAGGQATVVLAREKAVGGRLVAIKLVDTAAGPLLRERLLRLQTEAAAFAQLEHPHIVRIYSLGEHLGQPYLVLEYCEGGTLRDALKRQRYTIPAAVQVVETLARALHYAHSQGVIHRDVKPANVLFDANAHVKLGDFGLARFELSDAQITRSHQVLGTAEYMSPEQARGVAKGIGVESDVYSLGAILYELLTGGPPFVAEDDDLLKVMQKVRDEEPLSPRLRQPKTPRDLATVVLKCLEKDPARRYATALALAEDLQRHARGLPIQARRIGTLERSWRWCKRNRLLAALVSTATAAAILTCTLLALGLQFERSQRQIVQSAQQAESQARGEAETALARETEQSQRTRQLLAEARAGLYLAQVRRAADLDADGLVAQAEQVLTSLQPGPGEEDHRNFEWSFLAAGGTRTGVQRSPVLTCNHGAYVSQIIYSPDGECLASSGGDDRIRLWNAKTGDLIGSWQATSIEPIEFAPHGRQLVSASQDSGIQLWDIKTGEELARVCRDSPPYFVKYSSDGSLLAASFADGLVIAFDAATLTERHRYPFDGNEVPVLDFSPDNNQLLIGGDRVRVVEMATNRTLAVLVDRPRTMPMNWVRFSQDGKQLLTVTHDFAGVSQATLQVWDTSTFSQQLTQELHDPNQLSTSSFAFRPDCRHLAWIHGESLIGVCEIATGSRLTTIDPQEDVSSIAFSPDGLRLASAGEPGQIKIWDIHSDSRSRVVHQSIAPMRGVTFSPDGRSLACAGDDKVVRSFDLETLQEGFSFDAGGEVQQISYTAAGNVLVVARSFSITKWDTQTCRGDVFVDGTERLTGMAVGSACAQVAYGIAKSNDARIWDSGTQRATRLHRSLSSNVGHNGTETLLMQEVENAIWNAGVEVRAVAISASGRHLAAGKSDGSLEYWDLAKTSFVRALSRHKDAITALALSGDDQYLATAGRDATVRIWHAPTGQERVICRGHRDAVLAISLSPDGRRLASAGADGTIRLWSVPDGQPLLVLRAHSSAVNAVTFSPDGQLLASAGDDGSVRLWIGQR